MRTEGNVFGMTGDGVNNAQVLAIVNVDISVEGCREIATATNGIVLVKSNLEDIVNLIVFGKRQYRKMIQILFWAVGYNFIVLPLTAGAL